MDCDVVIIGGGPAGLAAAVYGASEGLSITIVDAKAKLGGQAAHSALVENLIGFPHGISGAKLMENASKQAKHFGVNVLHDGVCAIAPMDDGCKLVQLESGRVLQCKAVVLATGVQWRKLNIPGEVGTFGVFYGADPHEMAKWAGKRVAIIGGANSAGQAARGFAHAGAEVTMFARSPLAKSMSTYLQTAILKENQVIVKEGEAPLAVEQVGNIRVRLTTTNTSEVFDGVFCFIGAEPHTSWLPVEKDPKGFILTGMNPERSLETSIPGVFAAGDVRANRSKRIGTAIGEGSRVVSEIHQFLTDIELPTAVAS